MPIGIAVRSMILGAGLESLHSGTIPEEKKEMRIAFYAGGAALVSIILFFAVPLWGHRFMLWLPMTALLPLVFLAFAGLGFLLGHVVPLSIDRYSFGQPHLMAWSWAITVAGSVFGTVFACILARDCGMSFVAALGVLSYFCVVAVNIAGMALSRLKARTSGAAADSTQVPQ